MLVVWRDARGTFLPVVRETSAGGSDGLLFVFRSAAQAEHRWRHARARVLPAEPQAAPGPVCLDDGSGTALVAGEELAAQRRVSHAERSDHADCVPAAP